MKHWLVIGRIIGDDEDTCIQYYEPTVQAACVAYRAEMYEMEKLSDEEIDRLEANGEGVAINHVFECPGYLKEVMPSIPA